MEPLQMKKKKKGVGFNLRKSLAWDRAFFTDEGVLDPQELSVISGGSCGEELYFVNEHTPVGSGSANKHIDIEKIKNNTLTKLQNEDLAKETKKDGSSTSHKVPALVGCNKSGSSCSDIPRPLSSSLKRPANANVGRTAGKELKLLKVPGSKPGHSPVCTTNKKTISRANCAKRDQISQPGLKSSWESLKKTQNASNSLQPTLYSNGNSDNALYRRYSSINMNPVLVDETDNSGSNLITPVRPVHASEDQHESETLAVPLFQTTHFSGRTSHPLQNQVLKPSGLRMPSPSLSFFSQTIPSVNVSLRATGTDVCGFQRHESFRWKENLRALEVDDRIQQVRLYSNAISSMSVCTASSHVTAVASLKPIMEKAPIRKIQHCSKKNQIEKISDEEAELQSIDNKVSSRCESCEHVTNEIFLKSDTDGYPEKSESCEGGWKNPEQKHVIQESETVLAIDELSEEKNTRNHLLLSQGATVGTQCEDTLDHRVERSLINQSDVEDACKSDCHGSHRGNTDSVKCPLGETDHDNNSLKLSESEQLGVTRQYGGWCSRSGSLEALECRMSEPENSYLESKDLHADLSTEASVSGVFTDNLLSLQPRILDAACDPNVGECKDSINLISEVGDDIKQPGKGSEIFNNCPVAGEELQVNIELNTILGLPQKQTCLEGLNIEKLAFLYPDINDGSKVADTMMANTLSMGESHDCEFLKDKIVGQTLSSTYFDSVNNSVSPEKHKNVLYNTSNYHGKTEGDINCVLNGPANHELSNGFHEGSQRTEIDYISLSPISRIREVSFETTVGKVAEKGSIVQDVSTNNQLTLSVSLKENEFDIDSLGNVMGSGTLLVQPPEGCMLDECCSQQPENLTLHHANFGAETREHGNVGFHFENYLQTTNPSDNHRKDNKLGSKELSTTEQSKTNTTHLKNPSIPARDSPLEHGSCEDEHGCKSHTADSTTDPQRVAPLSDTADSESSEYNNSSPGCIHPKLDAAKVEAALAQEDGLNDKSSSVVLPQNTIPFSDEWFAAIEAAGEDILTKKSGAVQNSPPDKSLPDPSPWSPVKKRNNQIGPFDCTKFTNNLPSEFN